MGGLTLAGTYTMEKTALIAYRVAVLAMLVFIAWIVHREGERISRGQWYPSQPIQVEVVNGDSSPIPTQPRQQDAPLTPAQTMESIRLQRELQLLLSQPAPKK